MPTTTTPAGTSWTTTALAPTRAPAPDRDRPQHLGAGADDGAIADGRMALVVDLGRRIQRGRHAAQGNAVVERHVVADLRRLADHHAHAVVDEEPPPDRRTRVDLDAREPAPELGNEAGEKPAPPRIEPVGDAVKEQNMYAGIGQQDLETRPGSRVASDNRVKLLANALENHYRRHDKVVFQARVPRTRLSR